MDFEDYEIVVGLEIHAELSTTSKIFCSCTTNFGGEVNSHCCPVCTGMPGTLPVLNKKVVEYAIKAGLALNCQIADISTFDRKNYFYPDLPKAYQISQYDKPLCCNGHVEIDLGDKKKKIGITRIHIEEDAGKLIHDNSIEYTLIDYNRCGVPLIEIVSEPDIRSSKEAHLFVDEIRKILMYVSVSDCKMQEGSLRADVNLSVRKKGVDKLGVRTEIKNLNSLKSISRAIESEAKRQIAEIISGNKIVQETRRWDDAEGKSISMRTKEFAHDYRYFPEPDLVPFKIENEWLIQIKKDLPEIPSKRKKRFIENFSITDNEADIITSSKKLADFFEDTVNICGNPKSVSNWILGDLLRKQNEKGLTIDEINIKPQGLAELVELVSNKKISITMAKKIFAKMFDTGKFPLQIMDEEGIRLLSDTDEILKIIRDVLKENKKSVLDFISGKEKAVGFLIGQVMKKSKGLAEPSLVNTLIIKELKECMNQQKSG